MQSTISKKIWLVNIGETLPVEGNKHMRMVTWMTELKKRGADVLFFTTDFEHQRKVWIQDFPENFHALKSYIPYKKNVGLARLLNHFFVMISFWRATKKISDKPDVIIVSYPTILLSLAAVIYAKTNDIKVITDFRDKWPDIFVTKKILQFFIWPLQLVKKYIVKNSTCISISPGYYLWATSENKLEAFDKYVLPLSNSHYAYEGKRNLDKNEVIKFIFIGSLGLTYSLESIIVLHETLLKNNINFVINVCGDGPEREKFEEMIVNKAQINFLGWCDKNTMNTLLSQAHFGLMFYNPDSPQGWPNKLIEYMSFGLPMINLLKGESWKLIEDARLGLNLEINELDKVIPFINELSQSTELYEGYSTRNIQTFKNTFSSETCFKKLTEIINQ